MVGKPEACLWEWVDWELIGKASEGVRLVVETSLVL